MRYSVQLPTDRVDQLGEFVSVGAICEMAQAVEAAGFDACFVTEHPFPSDDWLDSGGHHALDPFVALTAVATATERLRLHTNILVLAYRNPFLIAKSIASLDVLSGGRVIVGIAAGYLEAEYHALGADFSARNELTDEALVAMKLAWSGESVRFAGHGFEATGNTMLPRPIQRPHPPIWIGGNSKVAIRRAARYAQGWSPFPIAARFSNRTRTAAIENLDDLAVKINYLRDCASEEGREAPLDINFVPFENAMNARDDFDASKLVDQIHALDAIGVNWVSVGVPSATRAMYIENVAHFGEAVIAAGPR